MFLFLLIQHSLMVTGQSFKIIMKVHVKCNQILNMSLHQTNMVSINIIWRYCKPYYIHIKALLFFFTFTIGAYQCWHKSKGGFMLILTAIKIIWWGRHSTFYLCLYKYCFMFPSQSIQTCLISMPYTKAFAYTHMNFKGKSLYCRWLLLPCPVWSNNSKAWGYIKDLGPSGMLVITFRRIPDFKTLFFLIRWIILFKSAEPYSWYLGIALLFSIEGQSYFACWSSTAIFSPKSMRKSYTILAALWPFSVVMFVNIKLKLLSGFFCLFEHSIIKSISCFTLIDTILHT